MLARAETTGLHVAVFPPACVAAFAREFQVRMRQTPDVERRSVL